MTEASPLISKGERAKVKYLLRPLLNIQKKKIQKYLDENNLKYFIDESNFDTKIMRNKLRIEILPKFEEINKNYKENISNLMNYFGEVKENIDEEVQRFLGLNYLNSHPRNFEISAFNSLSPFLQKEVIRYIYFISN
jgi:tRNA(Ile)-lysidine synthase